MVYSDIIYIIQCLNLYLILWGSYMFRPLLILTLILTLTSLLITGCGQKGPLYLPTDKPTDAAKPAHIKQAHRAVAVSKKQQDPVKKSSAVKLDEKNLDSVDNLTNSDVKSESTNNSGTIHVSGS